MKSRQLLLLGLAVVVALPLTLLVRLEWVSSRGRSCVEEVLARGDSGSCRIGARVGEYLADAADSDGKVLSSRVLVSRGKPDYRWQHTVEVTRERCTRVEHWDGKGYAVGAIRPEIVLASSISNQPSSPQR